MQIKSNKENSTLKSFSIKDINRKKKIHKGMVDTSLYMKLCN